MPDGTWRDAETAARIVLADVAHRVELDPELRGPATDADWLDLADQLRRLLRPVPQRD